MTNPKFAFEVVGEKAIEPTKAPEPAPKADGTGDYLIKIFAEMLSLESLAQRFVVALGRLFALLTVGSAFALWCMTPDPSVIQVISLSIYAAFVLTINGIILWRK